MMVLVYMVSGVEKRITGVRTVIFAHLHQPDVEGVIAYADRTYMIPLSAVQAIVEDQKLPGDSK